MCVLRLTRQFPASSSQLCPWLRSEQTNPSPSQHVGPANPFPLRSKWFLDALGHQGLNNLLAAYEDKSATAVCTFAFCAGPGQEPILFQGRTPGKIVPPRGPANFGKLLLLLPVETRSPRSREPLTDGSIASKAGIPSSSTMARLTPRWINRPR
jgi:hypothetical protein